MNAPLILTRQNADNPVFVPAEITEKLKDYDIDSVRHIYKFYQKKTNVVINTDDGINEPKSLHAFLTAVKIVPVLIVSSDSDIDKWEAEFKMNDNLNVKILEHKTVIVEDCDNMIVLAAHSILRRALYLREINWQLLVVQNIDAIIDLPAIKKLNAKFRIAITKYNFVLNPNLQLYSKILKWITDNGKQLYTESYIPNQWLRLSWHQYDPLTNEA